MTPNLFDPIAPGEVRPDDDTLTMPGGTATGAPKPLSAAPSQRGNGGPVAEVYNPNKAARRHDPTTSHEAAQAAKYTANRFASMVLAVHRAHPAGLIDDEVKQLLPDVHEGTVTKRRGDLTTAGYIVKTSARRPTRSGRAADVYAISPAGNRYALEHGLTWRGARLGDLAHPEAVTKFTIDRLLRTCQVCGYVADGSSGAKSGKPGRDLASHLAEQHAITVDWENAA